MPRAVPEVRGGKCSTRMWCQPSSVYRVSASRPAPRPSATSRSSRSPSEPNAAISAPIRCWYSGLGQGTGPWHGQPAHPGVIRRHVLAHGEDLREVRLARGDLLTGGDVAAVGELTHQVSLLRHRLGEEPSARVHGVGHDAALGGGGGDLKDAVALPCGDHLSGQLEVGSVALNGFRHGERTQLRHEGAPWIVFPTVITRPPA